MYTPSKDGEDEPEHLARYLSAPIEATWRAFDRGHTAAEEYFADRRVRPYDPHLWAHIARYEAVQSLKSEPKPSDWTFKILNHSGIELRMDGFRLRVCKAYGDGPQSPGGNRARKSFFQQKGLFGSLMSPNASNLLLYWRVASGNLELGLCKPTGYWKFRSQPKLEWRQPVSFNPFEGLSFPTANDDEPFGFEEFGFGDEAAGT